MTAIPPVPLFNLQLASNSNRAECNRLDFSGSTASSPKSDRLLSRTKELKSFQKQTTLEGIEKNRKHKESLRKGDVGERATVCERLHRLPPSLPRSSLTHSHSYTHQTHKHTLRERDRGSFVTPGAEQNSRGVRHRKRKAAQR